MADITEAGQPIKSPGNTDDKVEAQLVDGVTPSQKATVDSDLNLHVEAHGHQPDETTDVVLRLSEKGDPNPQGDHDATNNSKPASIGLIGHDRGAAIDETSQNKRLTGVAGADNTVCLDVAIRDEAGAAFSESNPIPVALTESEGTEVQDFSEGADVASGAANNHDYSVANGDVFLLYRVIASASGRGKYTLDIGDGAATEVFATKAIQFGTESNPNVVFDFSNAPIRVVGTVDTTTVRVIRANTDDDDAQDMHSTIIGVTKS